MDATARIERAIERSLDRATLTGAPRLLGDAMRYAVLPGGARVRPHLCLAVAGACGADQSTLTDSMAAAIEFLHCASLIHDDLPCFDNAEIRRGKPSVHAAFGEPIAVLAGDALIVLAFETLAQGAVGAPARIAPMLTTLAQATGMPAGIAAGQAWECEPSVPLSQYHRQKTGSLFVAATVGGALSAGAQPDTWVRLGECIGEAYQVADDIKDIVCDAATMGKPRGQDLAHARPSATRHFGLRGAVMRLEALLEEAVDSIPACRGKSELTSIILAQAKRLVPKDVGTVAA